MIKIDTVTLKWNDNNELSQTREEFRQLLKSFILEIYIGKSFDAAFYKYFEQGD